MATNAISPPDMRLSVESALPGGCTLISMPQESTSLSSSSTRLASPPPNSSVKTRPKFSLMARKLSVKMSFIWPDRLVIILVSSFLLPSTSYT